MGQTAGMEKVQSSIPALMPDFLARLAHFCRAEHGRVSRLAADLGIAQPHVSAWLTGRQAPSGEYVLRIQAWLARHESSRPNAAPRFKPITVRRSPPSSERAEPEEVPVWLL
jgi:transcriptional regulator with XRE-family HTH domain